jgi:hypothetical protein
MGYLLDPVDQLPALEMQGHRPPPQFVTQNDLLSLRQHPLPHPLHQRLMLPLFRPAAPELRPHRGCRSGPRLPFFDI